MLDSRKMGNMMHKTLINAKSEDNQIQIISASSSSYEVPFAREREREFSCPRKGINLLVVLITSMSAVDCGLLSLVGT